MHSDTVLAGADPAIGRVLKEQYRIDSELGTGAMGVVYRGTHVKLGKPVVIKMMREGSFLSRDAQERFEREARTASTIVHPGVAHVFDYGIEDNVPFLVMEYVDGKELADVIAEEGPMPPARAVAIMRQLASALEEAHRHGVVHRDIKPQNLKLMRYQPGGQIYLKVLDFGIAKKAGPEQSKLTATGAVIGTPMYMAPEQAAGSSREVDGRADQYAAGIVLYEMLTGHVPFTGDSLAGVLVSHLTQPPPPLPRSVPEPLRQIVERLLKKQPEERFPDCGALDRALMACEAVCRDVPPLGRDSVQPVVSTGVPQRSGGLTSTLGFGLGALAVAGATLLGALTLAPRLRRPAPMADQKDPEPPPPRPTARPAPVPVAEPPPPPRQNVSADRPVEKQERPHRGRKGRDGAGDGGGAAEEPPTARGPANPEAKAKLEEAEHLFQQKQYSEAIQIAAQSLGLQRSGRAWQLITLSRCHQGDLGNAKAALRNLSAPDQRRLIERCKKIGLDLTD